jgi:hypothetical protein
MSLPNDRYYRFCVSGLMFCLLSIVMGCTSKNDGPIKQKPIKIQLVAEGSVQEVNNKEFNVTEYSILVTNNSEYGMHYFNFYHSYNWPENTNRSLIYFIVDEDGKKYPHCGHPSSTHSYLPKNSKVIGVGDTFKIYLTVGRVNDEDLSDVFRQRFCIKSHKDIFLRAFYIELQKPDQAYDEIRNGNYKIIASSNLIPLTKAQE